MKYLDYHEKRIQGTINFPIAFYHIDYSHPRYEMTYHWHREFELIYIKKGSFELTVDDTTTLLHTDDIFLLQSGILHRGHPNNCTYECIVFDFNYLFKDNYIHSTLINNIAESEILIDKILTNTDDNIINIAKQLFITLRSKKRGYEFVTKGLLLQLIGLIIEAHMYNRNISKKSLINHKTDSLRKVLSYIEKNYSEDISLSILSDIAGMNSKYFCRYFKSLTQQSPIEYLNFYRIEIATEQLLTSNYSITEVAFNCGFKDLSYFIKIFKRYKGITPYKYMHRSF